MKKHLVLLLLCPFVGVLAFIPAKRSLVGHWHAFYGNGVKGNAVFRKDGTYEATFEGSAWKVGGQYKLEGNISTITDSTCGMGYWAKYKATWYSDDSLRMTAIEDSCTGRKANADGAVMVREKM
jgi:hypothetical protein